MTAIFKNTKFHYQTMAEAVALQQAMFKLGFRWLTTKSGTRRTVKLEHEIPAQGFLYVDKDCRIIVSNVDTGFRDNQFSPAFQANLIGAAAAKKIIDRQHRKESRKRKAAASGFTANDFASKECPLPDGTKFVVMFRQGTVSSEQVAPAYRWNNIDSPGDIMSYKVTAAVKKPRTAAKKQRESLITLEDMVKQIVRDAGGKEVVNVDADGYIIFNGGKCPVPKGTLVDVKYREGVNRSGLEALADSGNRDAAARFWRHDGHRSDIVAYRLTPAVAIAPVTAADPALDPLANPKHAIGNTALPMTMVSPLFRAQVALAKQNGALKYGGANYIGTPVVMSTYLHAIQRHLDKIILGEDCDEVDGVPHAGAIGANLDIIESAKAAGTLIDDRLRADGQLAALAGLKPLVAALQALHKDRTPTHFYMKDRV